MLSTNNISVEHVLNLEEVIHERYQNLFEQKLNLDLSRGKPSVEQLALSNELLNLPGSNNYMSFNGIDCRNYSDVAGLREARCLFSEYLRTTPEQTIVANNSSLGLMHDALVFALLKGVGYDFDPWSKQSEIKFICPVPGYDRHFSLCEQYGIKMISVPMTNEGPELDLVKSLVIKDSSIKGMWCVPKYSNPNGIVYSDKTITTLASMPTAANDFRLFWDNAYNEHHLTEKRIDIPDIIEACRLATYPERAFVFSSTSKITFAGSGLALFSSSKNNISWILNHLSKRSICPDNLNQLRHVQFFKDLRGIQNHMDLHRKILSPKFTKINEIFETEFSNTNIAKWNIPRGGYFISLNTLEGCAKRAVELCLELGIKLTKAGATHPYGFNPNDNDIRIAPSFPSIEEVEVATTGIALSVILATIEKLKNI